MARGSSEYGSSVRLLHNPPSVQGQSSERMPAGLLGRSLRPYRLHGAPDFEFRLATEALQLEQSGLGYQRVPPGYRFPYGHTRKKQEELRGRARERADNKQKLL